mmetsp:Transcript_133138/g.235627  ORF Transcript_133138/g.235627 Transcript_133138/m.235627 type:complete len:504 (+) Transcript_133138:59-1570(+)
MTARIHRALIFAYSLCSAAKDSTCGTEVTCEGDVASVEDADATGVSVSLLQQDLPRLLKQALKTEAEAETENASQVNLLKWPRDTVRCSGDQTMKTQHMTLADYDDAVASVQRLYDRLPASCDAARCARSDWAGCILRLAAHDFMDYSHQEGGQGADGCLYLPDGDNAGLSNCLAGSDNVVGLLDAYEDFCTRISLADFLVIGAEAVMNITRQNVLDDKPSHKGLDFRARFKYGRVTNPQCNSAIGVMPDAERGCDAVKDTMISKMGLTWTQAAALMGAHTIGQASLDRSGYNGRWVPAKSSLRFDNDYFLSIILKGWAPEKMVGGNDEKNQWKRVDIGTNEYAYGVEMMLDSDMCLYHSPYDHQVVPNPLHASISGTQGCNCAWVRGLDHLQAIANNDNEFCGTKDFYPGLENLGFGTSGHLGIPNENTLNFTKQRIVCCGVQEGIIIDPKVDCGLPNMPWGPAAAAVAHFAADEEDWLTAYHEAWDIATTNGYSSLAKLKD